MTRRIVYFIFTLLFACLYTPSALAQESTLQLLPGFGSLLIADSFDLPVDMEFTPTGDILVAEKGQGEDEYGISLIKRVHNGEVSSQPVLSHSTHVYWESGLHSFILDPNFSNNGFMYVWYASGINALGWTGETSNRLSRFTYDFATHTAGDERIMLDIGTWAQWHHGGGMIFDNDGYLYLAIGEHGGSDRISYLNNYYGKIIRIKPHPDATYSVEGNPYAMTPYRKPEIWAIGLRNPYQLTYRTNDNLIMVGDVGGGHWEEVSRVTISADYGWPEREGPCPRGQFGPCTTSPSHVTDPTIYWPHTGDPETGLKGAITGLSFYQGTSFPEEYHGVLFFGDLTHHWISYNTDLDSNEIKPFASNYRGGLIDLKEYNGNLYALSINTGEIIMIYYTGSDNALPIASLETDKTQIDVGETVRFIAAASDADDTVLFYHWDFGDGTTHVTNELTVSHTYTTTGNFKATLQVIDIRGGESSLIHQNITAYGGELPVIQLTNMATPARDLYHAGDIYSYSATRSTMEGLDPDTPYTWRIDLHHNTHVHILMSSNQTTSDVIELPTDNHDSDWHLWYEFILTMHTAEGLEVIVRKEIFPALVDLTFETQPENTQIEVNSIQVRSPYTIQSIVGIDNQAIALPNMLVGKDIYTPTNWTDSVETITTTLKAAAPDRNTIYTATYIYDRPAYLIHLPIIHYDDSLR